MHDGASGEDKARFLTEAKVTAQLEHPNIVPVHELGRDEQGRVFYTMKRMEGSSLRDVLAGIKEGDEATIQKWPLRALLEVFVKVCDGLGVSWILGTAKRSNVVSAGNS